MGTHFKSCVFEHLRRMDGFCIAVTAFIAFVDFIDGGLVSDFHSRNIVSP